MEESDHFSWPTGFRALAPEAVERLAQAGTRLIGVDVPSVDPETSKELPSHMACRRHDIRIIENLVLADVMPGDYELIALAVTVEGARRSAGARGAQASESTMRSVAEMLSDPKTCRRDGAQIGITKPCEFPARPI